MTLLQYITSPATGCCTTGELMAYSKVSKEGYEQLKEYARQEMKNKNIPLTEK
jgi:hypothetical protein